MFQNPEDIIRFVAKDKVTMIDLKFIDLFGAWHHITLPAKFLNDEFFREGVGFEDSSMRGAVRLKSRNKTNEYRRSQSDATLRDRAIF